MVFNEVILKVIGDYSSDAPMQKSEIEKALKDAGHDLSPESLNETLIFMKTRGLISFRFVKLEDNVEVPLDGFRLR